MIVQGRVTWRRMACASCSAAFGSRYSLRNFTQLLVQRPELFEELGDEFRRSNVFVVSLVSSPGSGKTTFLKKILTLLRPDYRVAALVGDLATENDAQRLPRSGAPSSRSLPARCVICEAAMVRNALQTWDITELDFLFVENVGNLVCPSSYDLGENLRLVVQP